MHIEYENLRMRNKTAKELQDELHKDPSWVKAYQAKHCEIEQQMKAFRREEKPLIDDLLRHGVAVQSVWDLVNSEVPYPGAVEVLGAHLERDYHPKILEGIARALTVTEAKGTPAAKRVLATIQRLSGEGKCELRWALANAMVIIADSQMTEQIARMCKDAQFADCHERLRLALKNSNKEK